MESEVSRGKTAQCRSIESAVTAKHRDTTSADQNDSLTEVRLSDSLTELRLSVETAEVVGLQYCERREE